VWAAVLVGTIVMVGPVGFGAARRLIGTLMEVTSKGV